MDYCNNTKILRNNNNNSSFLSHPLEISSNNNLIHNSYHFGRFSGLEVAQHHIEPIHEMLVASNIMNPSTIIETKGDEMMIMRYGKNKDKMKRRLSSNQLESLESSFEEERKLDPDRKMKLAKELGLQPRQVAVWFQNRRARWKAKKLEHLYDALKHEFDVVSKEKQMLQHEVQILKSMLMEQGTKKQVNSGNTEASCEETVESTSNVDHNINNVNKATQEAIFGHNKVDTHYLFNVDVYNNTVSPSYWGALA